MLTDFVMFHLYELLLLNLASLSAFLFEVLLHCDFAIVVALVTIITVLI